MKQYLCILIIIVITNAGSAQGVTKYGQSTNTSTNFVIKNGKLTNKKSLGKNGQNLGLPGVTTINVDSVTQLSAVCYGNVTDSGSSAIINSGVCWNSFHYPSIADLTVKTSINGTGNFKCSINGLFPFTTYYLRAFATNSSGTSYGDLVSFYTSSCMSGNDNGVIVILGGWEGSFGAQGFYLDTIQTGQPVYSFYSNEVDNLTLGNCEPPAQQGLNVDVSIKNTTSTTFNNVSVEITDIATPYTAMVSDPFFPLNSLGSWYYGDIAPGDIAMRAWNFRTPDQVQITFHGRIVSSSVSHAMNVDQNVYERGEGSGWGASIKKVYLSSDGSNLSVQTYLNPNDKGNNLYVLIDNLNRDWGISDLTGDVGLGWGSLALSNSAGLTVEFACTGWRDEKGIFNAGPAKQFKWVDYYPDPKELTITDESSVITPFDNKYNNQNGLYGWKIPYAAIGASTGAVIGVYVLYGKDLAAGGIHSAAPVMSPAQITKMNSSGTPGLTDIDRLAPGYILK